jgi:hypothetical protein
LTAVLVDPEPTRDEGENVRQSPLVLGVTVLTFGIFSVGPGVRATEPIHGDTNGNAADGTLAPDGGAPVSLPFQTTENLSLGAVTESSAEEAEADKLALPEVRLHLRRLH